MFRYYFKALFLRGLLFAMVIIGGNNQVYSQERPAIWAQPVKAKEVRNFFKLNNEVYRSSQPSDDGFKELEKLGIVTVLNLRKYHSDDDNAEGTTIKTCRVKIETDNFTDKEVIEALKFIKTSPKPILIHCWHGSDRTGLICAMYRIVFQNWSKQDALNELVNGGYGYHKMFKNIPEYIEKVNIESIRKALEM